MRRTEDLFLRYGIKSITMDDVARELGISKKTLYQFVENKEDLVARVMDRHISEQCSMDEEIHRKATDAVDEMFKVIAQVVSDMQRMKPNVIYELQKYHREVWERIQQFQWDYLYKVTLANIEWGRRDGLYRTDFDETIAARFYIYGSFAIFDERLFPKPQYPFDTLFKEYILNYLHGIASDKGRELLKAKLG